MANAITPILNLAMVGDSLVRIEIDGRKPMTLNKVQIEQRMDDEKDFDLLLAMQEALQFLEINKQGLRCICLDQIGDNGPCPIPEHNR